MSESPLRWAPQMSCRVSKEVHQIDGIIGCRGFIHGRQLHANYITHGAGVGRLVGGGDGLNVRLSHSVPK